MKMPAQVNAINSPSAAIFTQTADRYPVSSGLPITNHAFKGVFADVCSHGNNEANKNNSLYNNTGI